MAGDKLSSAYKASRTSSKAPAGKGKATNNVAASILAGARSSTLAPPPVENTAPEKPKDWWEQTQEGIGHAFEQPVIKQIIDLISSPGAAITTSLSNVQHGAYDAEQRAIARAKAKGQEGTGDLGNRMQMLGEELNPFGNLGHIADGIAQGAQLAVGDREGVKYGGDIVRDAQEYSGMDPNTSEGKWLTGLGGLGIDIALDPMNAVTGGGKAAAAAKGYVRGAKQFKSEASMVAKGEQPIAGIEATRSANAKKQAAIEVAKYNKLMADNAEAKAVRKETKKLDPAKKAEYLIENISTLQPAVAKAMLKDKKLKEGLSEKVSAGTISHEKMQEIVDKVTKTGTAEAAETIAKAEDALNEAVDTAAPIANVAEEVALSKGNKPQRERAPIVGLGQFKEPSNAEDIFNKLQGLTSTQKKKVYGADVVSKVNTHMAARPEYIERTITEPKVPVGMVDSPDVIPGAGVQAVKPGKGTSANLQKAIAAQQAKGFSAPAASIDDAYSNLVADLQKRKGTMIDEATGKKITYKKAAEAIDKHLAEHGYDSAPNFESIYNLPTEVLKEHGFIKATGTGSYDVRWGKTADEAVPMPKVENKFEEFGAKPGEIPDVVETVKNVKAYIRGEMKAGGNPTFRIPNPLKPDQVVTLSKEDFLKALSQGNPRFKSVWNSKDLAEFRVFKQSDEAAPVAKVVEEAPVAPVAKAVEAPAPVVAPVETVTRVEKVKNPKAITDEELIKLGVDPGHVVLLRQGKKIEDITDDITSTDIKHITDDIRSGVIPQEVADQFYNSVGDVDPAKVADYIETIAKTPEFQAVAANAGKTVDPLVAGHNKLASPTSTPYNQFTEADILASKTPTTPEVAQQFLEAKYSEHSLNLASHPDGVRLRALADEVFAGTIDAQRRPAGPLVMKGGASANEARTAAKYEKLYNTHSGMWRMKHIIETVRTYKYKHRGLDDDAIMSVMNEVDARLRLAGFDQHLSNMQTVGDKLVVRLSPSDVLNSLTRSDRIKYLWGNKKFSGGVGELHEFLPTQLLDIGEVLVRSATKLLPSGELDTMAMLTNATHALQGKYSAVVDGKRVIQRNLDSKSLYKNNEEILRQLDKETKGVTAYHSLWKGAKTDAERANVLKIAKDNYPHQFTAISERRMTTITHELFSRFTKNLTEGKSPVNELINANLLNASLRGGSVAEPVAQASAEFSAKILRTLDEGSLGEAINALVAKPNYTGPADIGVQAVLKENREVAQRAVATPEEIRNAEALDKNVKLAEQAAKDGTKVDPQEAVKNNVEGYQKEPAMQEELAKPLDEMNTEKIFDLAMREKNKDTLYKLFGFSRFFNKRTGIPLSFDVIAGSTHASSLLMTGFHEILRDLTRKGYTNEELRLAFQELKAGPPATQIAGELNAVLSSMFNPEMTNFLSRSGVGPEHLNVMLKAVKFDEKFRVPLDATPQEMMNAWKQWDVVDVKDFFSKMMGAMVKTAEDVSMGASFSKHFGSAVPKPGYSKVVDTTYRVEHGKPKHNPFLDLIDQSLYYPDEIMGEFVHIGRLLTESRSFEPGTWYHTLITKVVDPVISNLKMTQTTLKPGHHVMSVIGDTWRNSLALSTIGMMNPAHVTKLYYESARILASSVGEISELSSFQKFQRTQGITNELKIAKDGQTGSEFFGNIKGGGRIGHQNLYALMQANGIALPAHLGGMAEDFLTDFDSMNLGEKSANRVINGVQKVTEGLDRLANPIKPKPGFMKVDGKTKFSMKANPYSLNKFTAHRDTWTRGVLFLGAMRSKNFASVEEAVKYSAEFVRKWSPTAADLGAGESKYLRRGIFYYTWIRGMVPRIIESSLMRPGVAILPNRAMYNLAYANGLDPQSIGDPFPPDQLFPAWFTERVIGPQWKDAQGDLWGINPTGPMGDVLNALGSNVKPKDFMGWDALAKTSGTIANMSNPFIKAPIEAISGRTLQSGAPIDDRAQYLQDYVGPARVLSRALGKDLYPAMGPNGVAFPNRTEAKYRGGMTPEQTVQNAIPELANFGLGMGLTNYTSDSASKSAQFQKKDELTKAKKEAERFK